MRVVLQRVSHAAVEVDHQIVGQIEHGILALIGVSHDDTLQDAKWLAEKTTQLRIFADDQGKMNRSVLDVGGGVLVVSQFTLLGDCRKGRRPAFTAAADPAIANELYLHYADQIAATGIKVAKGIFAADMKVSLVNDGPVTMVIDRCEKTS
ncbi:D-tyrosyl-tRNA(Tyr) deacylase [Rubripirellula amarantea]|uniref:D-aminoacyl-tRNA deacylase n=1 Tax=Rubripirellula amarantea TaxID=2527999 RepID=A0A5C5WSI8_9BACT|nr:D-aminoacyl-tRNA deacylase [Rubripirellula amarantea]TWT53121.1 D-tyrosyl-tRNA(Tyr) deacylase [Rubripirellula amarantea]